MTPTEIDRLELELSKATHYLEYGSGASTKRALAHQQLRSIVSVESDPQYAKDALLPEEEVKEAMSSGRLKFYFPNIGPTVEWGVPGDLSHQHQWPLYAMCPYEHSSAPDLILIDGRFRVACGLMVALKHLSSTVLVHDYDRPQYKILEEFFELEAMAERLAVLRVKSSFCESRARSLLKLYSYAPEDVCQSRYSRLRRRLKSVLRRDLKNA